MDVLFVVKQKKLIHHIYTMIFGIWYTLFLFSDELNELWLREVSFAWLDVILHAKFSHAFIEAKPDMDRMLPPQHN